jgi:segregation and condensation protein B
MKEKTSRIDKRICNLEAALYSAGRPLNLEDLKKVANTRSDNVIGRLIRRLTKKYEKKCGALEVKKVDRSRIALQLRPEFDEMVKQFNRKPLLTIGPLKTLSYIAFYQPVEQREIVEIRGSHVYSQLKTMENMGLIHRERTDNRTYVITTTPFFSDYFGFSHDPAYTKMQLKQIFKQLKITKLENGDLWIEDFEEEELEKILANPRNGLPEGLAQYPGSSNEGAQ